MKTNTLKGTPLTCWVCVFKEQPKPEKYNVVYSANIGSVLKKTDSDQPLLYLRPFACVQEAIGHKLFLESLTNDSIRRVIVSMNPNLKNLRPLVDDYLI